jgi:hypothetical protein
VPSNLPFILCLESLVDACVYHSCDDALLPTIKLAVRATIKHYKAHRPRPDLLQVLDIFCKINASVILDALASKKSFEQLRHPAFLFLDLLASSRRATLEPLATKVTAIICKIITEARKSPSVSAPLQLATLNALNAAARLQLMLPSGAEHLVSFLADASCSDLPPSIIKSAIINLAENSALQPHLWPHLLNAFAASTFSNSGPATAHLSHALARLSSTWASAGCPVSWSLGFHVPSAAALLSRLFLSIVCCHDPTSSGPILSDVLNSLLHSLNNMSLLLAENAREIIRSHVLSISLSPLPGAASTPRTPAASVPSPVTPLSPVSTISFSKFVAPLTSGPSDQSAVFLMREVYVKLWGSVVAASGSASFAQQACDALCAFSTSSKISSKRSAEDEIIACLHMLSATAQVFITPACCRCILDCCFDVGISSPSRGLQTAAHEAFIAAAKLDHNEAAASLQRHVEAPTKSLLKNFLTLVDRAGGGKGTKKAHSEQGRIVAFAMQICGRILSESSVDASLVARTHALCGTYLMPLLERDMARGDAAAILQAARAIVGFVEAQGNNSAWMVNDSRDSGGAVMWNYPYSLSSLLTLVNSASAIVIKLASSRGSKSRNDNAAQRGAAGPDPDSLSPVAYLPAVTWPGAVAAAAVSPIATDASSTTGSSDATLGLAVAAVVEAAIVLCSRSNSRFSPIVHSIALQFVRLCSTGDVLWRTLDDSAAERLLHAMTVFLCDVVALGGRNVELSVARAVAAAGAPWTFEMRCQ